MSTSEEETPDYIRRVRVVSSRILDGVTYTLEWTRCGHADRCGRCRVAYYGHGPYWYARYWDAGKGERGRVVTRYIGRYFKQVPSSQLPDRAPRGRPPIYHWHEPWHDDEDEHE